MRPEVSMSTVQYIPSEESFTGFPRRFDSLDAAKHWLTHEKPFHEVPSNTEVSRAEGDVCVFKGERKEQWKLYGQDGSVHWVQQPKVTLKRSNSGNHAELNCSRDVSRFLVGSRAENISLKNESLIQSLQGPKVSVPFDEYVAIRERQDRLQQLDIDCNELNALADNATSEELLQIAKHPNLGKDPSATGIRDFIKKIPTSNTAVRQALLDRSDIDEYALNDLAKHATTKQLLQIAKHATTKQLLQIAKHPKLRNKEDDYGISRFVSKLPLNEATLRQVVLDRTDIGQYGLRALAENATPEMLLQIAKCPNLGMKPNNVYGFEQFASEIPEECEAVRQALLERSDIDCDGLNALAPSATDKQLLQIAEHPGLGKSNPYGSSDMSDFVRKVPQNNAIVRQALLSRQDITSRALSFLKDNATIAEQSQIESIRNNVS